MKLIKFDVTNSSTNRAGASQIRFHKSGVISLSKAFVELSGFKAGDKVSIAQDEESPEDWYLIPDKENGFVLRVFKGQMGLCFNSAGAFKAIVSAFEYKTFSVAFDMAKQPTKLPKEMGGGQIWGILTATAKYKEVETVEE